LPEQTTILTIYPRYIANDGSHTNIRCTLKGCVWKEDSIEIANTTGQAQASNITIQIPFRKEVTGLEYTTPSEWIKLSIDDVMSGKYWSVSPRLFNFNTFPQIIRGVSNYQFDFGTSAQVATQESQFARCNSDVRRVRDINPLLDSYADTRMNVEYTSDMRFILLKAQLS